MRRLKQRQNIPLLILVIPLGRLILVNSSQAKKAFSPMLVTLSGILISVNAPHLPNANPPIVFTLSGKTRLFKPEQSGEKAVKNEE